MVFESDPTEALGTMGDTPFYWGMEEEVRRAISVRLSNEEFSSSDKKSIRERELFEQYKALGYLISEANTLSNSLLISLDRLTTEIYLHRMTFGVPEDIEQSGAILDVDLVRNTTRHIGELLSSIMLQYPDVDAISGSYAANQFAANIEWYAPSFIAWMHTIRLERIGDDQKATKQEVGKAALDADATASERFPNIPQYEDAVFACKSDWDKCRRHSKEKIDEVICALALFICFGQKIIPFVRTAERFMVSPRSDDKDNDVDK